MDETGVEPMTSPMLRERATNYATRPDVDIWRGLAGYLFCRGGRQRAWVYGTSRTVVWVYRDGLGTGGEGDEGGEHGEHGERSERQH
ncbi:hypothetical protein ACU8KH_01461 [Lachancea thermotolerans]